MSSKIAFIVGFGEKYKPHQGRQQELEGVGRILEIIAYNGIEDAYYIDL